MFFRSETPLLYKAVPSWFIRVELIVQQLLENNKKCYWLATSLLHPLPHTHLFLSSSSPVSFLPLLSLLLCLSSLCFFFPSSFNFLLLHSSLLLLLLLLQGS